MSHSRPNHEFWHFVSDANGPNVFTCRFRSDIQHSCVKRPMGRIQAASYHGTLMIEADARVLICLINQPRDLEIARWDHWYRIPLKRAPAEYLPDVLAFYLTADFGDEKWAIHEYADVRGHELVRRVDLFPDEPNHARASEVYFKMQLGPLMRLPRPILSLKWRRLTFVQTTGDRLLNALEIGELLERSSNRFVTLMDREMPPSDDEA